MEVTGTRDVPPTYCQEYVSCGHCFLSFMSIVTAIYQRQCRTNNTDGYPNNAMTLLPQYDFIVVGGGTAGAVVATRLSEIREWNVLLLEEGGDAPEKSNIPAISNFLLGTPMSWKLESVPQDEACLAQPERKCQFVGGKSLGGTTTVNGMTYLRGSKTDFDEWEKMGNPGWGYKDVLPYFKKSEDNKDEEFANTEYHGTGGYIPVQRFPYKHPLVDVLIKGANELGLPETDLNGKHHIGVMNEQATQYNGRRYSTSKAFLHRNRCRRNLHIAKCSYATRIVVDPRSKRVWGVQFDRFNQTRLIHARKEVILSAGVIGSPKLLLLSGIGPREHLEELNIPVIQDLKVGHNFHTHNYLRDGFHVMTDIPKIERETIENYELYYESGEGPLAGRGTTQVGMFARVLESNPPLVADTQLFFPRTGFAVNYGDEESRKESFLIAPVNLYVQTRGELKLQSTDPYDAPLINPRYFSDPADVKLLLAGIRFAEKLVNTSALRASGANFSAVSMPRCTEHKFRSDDYWICVIRNYAEGTPHMVGTCKMGPTSDESAVVDSELKVHGIQNLRVIDASIMPVIVKGNTQAATIMIGEKGADMIKKQWLKRPFWVLHASNPFGVKVVDLRS